MKVYVVSRRSVGENFAGEYFVLKKGFTTLKKAQKFCMKRDDCLFKLNDYEFFSAFCDYKIDVISI